MSRLWNGRETGLTVCRPFRSRSGTTNTYTQKRQLTRKSVGCSFCIYGKTVSKNVSILYVKKGAKEGAKEGAARRTSKANVSVFCGVFIWIYCCKMWYKYGKYMGLKQRFYGLSSLRFTKVHTKSIQRGNGKESIQQKATRNTLQPHRDHTRIYSGDAKI